MEIPAAHPTFREALRVWLRIGLLSFGGPAGQIALMHRELVDKRRWVSDRRFLHALNYCMLLPGPEAQQLAVYTGWLLHGTRGGLLAGALFVLPGALLMLAISCVYVLFGTLPWMEAIFYGLKAAVMAMVLAAVLRLGTRVLKHPAMVAIATASFLAVFAFHVPFPVIVLAALVIGLLFGRRYPQVFAGVSAHGGKSATENLNYVISDEISSAIAPPTLAGTLAKVGFWLLVWLVPLGLCALLFGPTHVLTKEGVFFSKAALVTFGGAYAVLPYVAQQAVEVHGWLLPTQMMDGLGLAETTPGPLILVLQFVGFLGGWNAPGGMPPLMTATLAAAITTWCTFIPGYLFIFAGAPFIEQTRGDLRLNNALSAVTAAVVGVILNLAVWFSWHVVVSATGRFNALPLLLSAVFLYLIQVRQWDMIRIVGLGAALGLATHLAGIR